MKALVYTGVEELVYREEKDPVETNGESILKVHASGICGSDMHAYHGKDERRIPLTPVQEPLELSLVEKQATNLAKFLDVNLSLK